MKCSSSLMDTLHIWTLISSGRECQWAVARMAHPPSKEEVEGRHSGF